MIDVSELMDDPDFLSPHPVVLVKRRSTVDTGGINNLQEFPQAIQAIVQPGISKDMLERVPDDARLKESISVWSRAKFEVERPGGYSDILTYKCRRWLVVAVDDFSTWGKGYTKCVATFEGMVK